MLKEILEIRMRPEKRVIVAIILFFSLIGVLHVSFSFPRVGALVKILLGGLFGYLFLGVILPLSMSKSSRSIGLTWRRLILSLLLNLILSIMLLVPLMQRNISKNPAILYLSFFVLCVTLFETVFFRGFLLRRFRRSFGTLPAILLSSLCYAIYSFSYPDWTSFKTMETLFCVNLMFSVLFLFTRNIFVIWPFSAFICGIMNCIECGFLVEWSFGISCLIISFIMLSIILRRIFRYT